MLNMTDEQIRVKIESDNNWKGTLIGFENCICKVEFAKYDGFFYIYPQGKKHEYSNLLTTLPFTKIESVVAFMQGSLYYYNHPKNM